MRSQLKDLSFSRFPVVPWSYIIIVHSFIFRFSKPALCYSGSRYPLTPLVPYRFLTGIFDVLSVLFLSLVRYVSKEHAFIPHSRLIPYSFPSAFFLNNLPPSFLGFLKRNGVVLTQSHYFLRRFNSRSKCVRIC